ncbi:diaminopimelate decarboxylase [Castellaniella sp.]|uniref:diaminopimelate decarboxylase n=1 Tax=Castellaniella sp. TaxID=1955812 RepID=UPI0035613CA4
MPIHAALRHRLYPALPAIAAQFGTPFHLYDEAGIRHTGKRLLRAFADIPGFREYYAIKALPNPHILAILRDLGFGFDCSSQAELMLARGIGAHGDALMFTSNNASRTDFEAALAQGGCILNLDDIGAIGKLPHMPELLCVRYNPGPSRQGNSIIGLPAEAKFGVPHHQLESTFRQAMARGACRFGLHTMLVSNELDDRYMAQTIAMLLDIVQRLEDALQIRFEFINMGGGIGIPYHPGDRAFKLEALGEHARHLLTAHRLARSHAPALYMESGRYITGPHGVLVTRVINIKHSYRRFIGVDASMSALMRPGMYGAYHHIEVPGKPRRADDPPVDVVGALCENNDKFAIQRRLPPVDEGDLLVIQDTGAHGHAMGFNYNGQLRPQELLLHADGQVERIRRAETLDDYFATLEPARPAG